MTYIPHTDEGFSSPVTDAPVGENAQRFMVGLVPRLSIRDEDAGYARVTEGTSFADRVWVYARLAPFTLRLPIFIDVQARLTGTWASHPTVVAATLVIVDESGFYIAGFTDEDRFGLSIGPWHNVTFQVFPNDEAEVATAAAEGRLIIAVVTILNMDEGYDVSFLGLRGESVEGRLAIDTHDQPFHVVGTRDPAMPYELVIDTGTQRLVEIVAGEEALATHELVIDETGRPGTPWSHCGLFRPL